LQKIKTRLEWQRLIQPERILKRLRYMVATILVEVAMMTRHLRTCWSRRPYPWYSIICSGKSCEKTCRYCEGFWVRSKSPLPKNIKIIGCLFWIISARD